MITRSITVVAKKEPDRAIPLLVQTASQYQSRIIFNKDEKTANVKSIMGMLNFGLVPGTTIDVTVEGEDEQEAIDRMEAFLTQA